MSKSVYELGLISDTHGLLRPEALTALRGCDAILHAGDIGDPAILTALAELASVTAVRGNNDRDACYDAIPETVTAAFGGVRLYLLHDLKTLALNPSEAGIRIVVSGHSHRPAITERDGVLYINPGSAGPRRFNLPISVGRLRIQSGEVAAEWVELQA